MRKLIFIFSFITTTLFAQDAFISGDELLCTNAGNAEISISFNGTAPFTFVYSVNGINKSAITTNLNPYVISTKEGGNFALTSFSDAIGVGTVSGGGLVTILEAPTSIISTITDTIHAVDPNLQFTSSSSGNIIEQSWNFGDNTLSQIINNPIHTFPLNSDGLGIASTYQVSLIVTDANSCTDTTFKNIFVVNDYWIYIPNSFSPDNDNLNDKFCIEFSGIRENTFSFFVINRQGEIIFETTDANSLKCSQNMGWDGKDTKGIKCIPTTYVYEMYFQEWNGWQNTKHGSINLVR